MKKLLITLVVIIIAVAFFRTQALFAPRLEQQRRVLMDTYVTVYALGKRPAVIKAINKAFARMKEAIAKLDAHNPNSPVYKFNQDGTPIRDKEILNVVKIALDVAKKSDGAFDVTIYPLVKLWGFYGENLGQVPTQEKIDEALNNIGYNHLILTDKELTSDKKNIHIDLGGIAKGYVISQGIESLKQSGIKSAIIQGGGDLYVLGYRNKKPWKVGIKHPRKNGLLGYLEINDRAVMGSGDYERFFIKDGIRYHHIIDPVTGYPAKGASGVTLIYTDPVSADAWATALSVLGPQGLKKIENISGMEAVIVNSIGEISYTLGLSRLLNNSYNNKEK